MKTGPLGLVPIVIVSSGWAHTAPGYAVPLYTVTFPQDPLVPDRLTPQPPSIWPENRVVAFHYPHPVTGRPVE